MVEDTSLISPSGNMKIFRQFFKVSEKLQKTVIKISKIFRMRFIAELMDYYVSRKIPRYSTLIESYT